MTEPKELTWPEKPIRTSVYTVNAGWYLEVVVQHPDNPEMPEQLMTIKCDNEWWARFLEYAIKDISRAELLNDFDATAPEFRYKG